MRFFSLLALLFVSVNAFAAPGDWYSPNVSTTRIGPSGTLHIDASTVSVTGNVSANKFIGDGSALTGISGGVGNVAWASLTDVPTQVEAVSNSGNITLNNLTAALVSATSQSGHYASFTTIAGPLSTAAQPNITSVGTLTGLTVSGLGTFGTVSVTDNLFADNVSATTLWVGGVQITGSGVSSWYDLSDIPAQVEAVSDSGSITLTDLTVASVSSSGIVTATFFEGDGSRLTNIPGGSSDWYDLTGIPTQVAAVSNSGGINLSSLGVTGTVTATTVSSTNANARQVSATYISSSMANVGGTTSSTLGVLQLKTDGYTLNTGLVIEGPGGQASRLFINSDGNLEFNRATQDDQLVLTNTSGNVGVGTASPNAKLAVAGIISGTTLRWDGGADSAGTPGVAPFGDTDSGFYSITDGQIGASTNGTQRLALTTGRLNSSLPVFIGDVSTAPSVPLHVSGTGWFTGGVSATGSVYADYAREGVTTVNATTATTTLNLAQTTAIKMLITSDTTISTTGANNTFVNVVVLDVYQDGTGGRTITWPDNARFDGSISPTVTTTANTMSRFTLSPSISGTTILINKVATGVSST